MKNLFYAALVRVTGPFEINVPSLFSMAGTIILYPRPSVARNTSHSPCSSARLLVLCCKHRHRHWPGHVAPQVLHWHIRLTPSASLCSLSRYLLMRSAPRPPRAPGRRARGLGLLRGRILLGSPRGRALQAPRLPSPPPRAHLRFHRARLCRFRCLCRLYRHPRRDCSRGAS
jgi:hypothetical protein